MLSLDPYAQNLLENEKNPTILIKLKIFFAYTQLLANIPCLLTATGYTYEHKQCVPTYKKQAGRML